VHAATLDAHWVHHPCCCCRLSTTQEPLLLLLLGGAVIGHASSCSRVEQDFLQGGLGTRDCAAALLSVHALLLLLLLALLLLPLLQGVAAVLLAHDSGTLSCAARHLTALPCMPRLLPVLLLFLHGDFSPPLLLLVLRRDTLTPLLLLSNCACPGTPGSLQQPALIVGSSEHGRLTAPHLTQPDKPTPTHQHLPQQLFFFTLILLLLWWLQTLLLLLLQPLGILADQSTAAAACGVPLLLLSIVI
jgi:hypothetical protein